MAVVLDMQANVSGWSSNAEKLTGYKAGEIIGRPFSVIFSQEQQLAGRPHSDITQAFTCRSYKSEATLRHKSGHHLNVGIVYTLLADASGVDAGYSVFISEPGSHSSADQALYQLARQVDIAYDAVFILTPDCRISTWNKGAEKLYGYSKEEAIGKDPDELLHSNLSPEEIKKDQKAAKEEEFGKRELKRRTRSGETVVVRSSVSPMRNRAGTLTGYMVMNQDITKEKNLQQKVQNLAALVEQSGKAIIFYGTDFRIHSWNKASVALFGFTEEEATGKTNAELGILKDPLPEIIRQAKPLLKAGSWQIDITCFKKDGSSFYGEIYGNALHGENGSVESYVLLIRDISERKLMEAALVKANELLELKVQERTQEIKQINAELESRVLERTEQLKQMNSELEAFTYSVSHDLRAPLRGIVGFSAILEEEYGQKLDEEGRRITKIIRRNTMKMATLIDDLLGFFRMNRQELNRTSVNTQDMVDEVIEELEQQSKYPQTFTWILKDLPEVHADRTTLRQVWINLISNAMKYSSKIPRPQIEIGSYTAVNEMVYYVKDNGVGFDEKYIGKLFKVFQRLHSSHEFEGTGVGLALVEKIISRHSGRVWAESKPDEGASFFFSIPSSK